MKKVLVLAIGLLFLSVLARTTSAAPVRVSSSTQLPFKVKGTLQANEMSVVNFPLTSVTASGSGQATQLGLFTFRYEGQVNVLDSSGVSSVHFVAENGESLYANATGLTLDSGTPNIFNVVEIYKITGGTGWLTNASGTISVHRVLNTATGYTSGTFEGIILIP
jgi:hypothetical protein